jgi:hypothetical protein
MSAHETTGGSNARDYLRKLAGDPVHKVEDKVVV